MKAMLIVLLGALLLVVQGALVRFVPAAACPDVALLLVLALAIAVGGTSGLLGAALLGLAGDLLSGSLLGQHLLLRVLAFGAVYRASGSLDLSRNVVLIPLAAVLTLAHALALGVSAAWAGAPHRMAWEQLSDVGLQMAVNAACAPLVHRLIVALSPRNVEEDVPRRAVTGRMPIASNR
jgi:rod shape-determining protein MreD